MKTTKQKYRNFLTIILLLSLSTVFAQVGINTTDPADGSILDITSSDKGIFIPRIELTNLTTMAPITGIANNPTDLANAEGLMVYNTSTTTGPGFFVWSGTNWTIVGDSNDDWKRNGNAGATAGNNFLGTTDAENLQMRTNNIERLRLLANGQVIINNTAAPVAGDRFTVQGNDTEDAINGYTTNSTGVYGVNASGIGNGVFGSSSNVGVRGYGGHGAILESGIDGGYGAVAWNTTASGTYRTGLIAIGQNLNPISLPSTGALLYGRGSGSVAFADDNDGTGIIGIGNSITTAQTLLDGSGIAGTGEKWGVVGFSTETGVNNPNNGSYSSGGGYFENGYGGYSVVAAWADPSGGGNNDQNFKILGNGLVSTIVKDTNENPVIMYAPEAPESLLQDYGVGMLTNGKTTVKLDPILSKNIRVDENHPLKVFVQLEGDCSGVFVTNKTATGFTVKELKNGKSNVPFSWSIVATRANEVFYDKKGNSIVSHNNLRFPKAPKPFEIKKVSKKENSKESINSQIITKSNLQANKKQQ